MIGNVNNLSRLRVWCAFGFLLSIYAAYVELRAEKDNSYTALCDVNSYISCTAVFTTVYGRGFGIIQQVFGKDFSWIPPNGVIGFLFYGLLFVSTYWKGAWVNHSRLILSIASNVLSLYLAYLLYFVLQNLCFICVSVYVVNFNILTQIWRLEKIKRNNDRLQKELEKKSK